MVVLGLRQKLGIVVKSTAVRESFFSFVMHINCGAKFQELRYFQWYRSFSILPHNHWSNLHNRKTSISIFQKEKRHTSVFWKVFQISSNKNNKIIIIFHVIYALNKQVNKLYYYSFKIFPHFWLVKTTHIIHHNQLLLTKCWTNDVEPLQIIERMTSKWH